MKRSFRTFLVALISAATLPIVSAMAEPVLQACATPGISVSSESPADAERACVVAARTDTLLRSLGLVLHDPVRIEVTETLDVAPGLCVALYSTEDKKLQVLPMDCLDDQPGRARSFPEMAPDILFESLIVHELVHAYVDQTPSGPRLPRIAHEYLAYAIQLDALPDAERNRVLAKSAIEKPVEFSAINEALLRFSPLSFAAMAWLHFDEQGGDAALVERILSGDILMNSLWE